MDEWPLENLYSTLINCTPHPGLLLHIGSIRRGESTMTVLAVLFVALIIAVAFYLNSILDKREEKRAKKHGNTPAKSD